jgi:hypothetical protein
MSRAVWMPLDAEDIPNNTKHKSKISLASHHHLISPCDYVSQSSHQTIQGFCDLGASWVKLQLIPISTFINI